jgi:hypothetical protein
MSFDDRADGILQRRTPAHVLIIFLWTPYSWSLHHMDGVGSLLIESPFVVSMFAHGTAS